MQDVRLWTTRKQGYRNIMNTPLELLSRLASDRGAIVSSADCSELEIIFASRDGRFYVDPETSYGYVLRFKEWRERAEGAIRASMVGDDLPPSSFPALEAEAAALLSLRAAQAEAVACWLMQEVSGRRRVGWGDVEEEEKALYRKLAERVVGLVEYHSCAHEFEGLKTANTADGPGEWHSVCRLCGAEEREDF